MPCILLLGNVRRSATETEILTFLQSAGLNARKVTIPAPGGKGFAFAYFATEQEVKDAIAALAGKFFQGLLINADWAHERDNARRPAPVKFDPRAGIETRTKTVSLAPDYRAVPTEHPGETAARDKELALAELNRRARR